MKRYVVGIIAAAVLVSMPRMAGAGQDRQGGDANGDGHRRDRSQQPHDHAQETDGTYVTTVAGPEVKRFAEIKIGDKVTARYYETLVIMMKPNSEGASTPRSRHDSSGRPYRAAPPRRSTRSRPSSRPST
jgi:hypothetical protein